jgi:hypothetical protein
MKGISFVTDDKGERTGLMIDLKKHDSALKDYLEDLMDLVEINARKNEKPIPWDIAKSELKTKGLIE